MGLHRFVSKPWWRVGVVLLALAALALPAGRADAQPKILHESLVTSNDSTPIRVSADNVSTWKEGDQRIFLVWGKAVIAQGKTQVTLPQGVVWIDEAKQKRTGVYEVTIYGEGEITLEHGAKVHGDWGFVHLATRGDVPIKAYKGKIDANNLSQHPTYLRGAGQKPAALPTPGDGVQRADVRVASNSGVQAVGAIQTPAKLPAELLPIEPVGNLVPAGGTQQPVAPQPLVPPQVLPPVSPLVEQKSFQAPRDNNNAPKETKSQQPPRDNNPPPNVQPIPNNGEPSLPPPPLPPDNNQPPPPLVPDVRPASTPPRRVTIRPRSQKLEITYRDAGNNTSAAILSTGGSILVTDPTGKGGVLDIEADRIVFWTKGNPQDLFNKLKSSGDTSNSLEFYLSGNVEIRTQTKKETEILRADEVYYDVARSVAIALKADLEIREPKIPYPIHVQSERMLQLNSKVFQANAPIIYSTILPSDPGLEITLKQITIEEKETPVKNWLGQPVYDKNGMPKVDKGRYFTGDNMFVTLEDVPVFYFPWLRGRVEDPLGPLENLNFNYNRIFGFQLYTTWDMYDLFGLEKAPGTRWRLFADYMTARGPALGTEFNNSQQSFFGIPGKQESYFKAYGIYDTGIDQLGFDRGNVAYIGPPLSSVPITHPDFRGRVLAKTNVQEMPNGFSVLGQLSYLSDRNFLEQFYQPEFANGLNQETFLQVKQQQQNWAWTILGEVRIRDWVTETEWLPKGDFYWLGQTFLDDWLVYNLHAGAGMARLRPTSVPSYAYLPTDVRTDTARLDLWQDVSVPFQLGALKVVPYATLDGTFYSQDVNGDTLGRAYGGLGSRFNLPLSKIYPDISSDLFNLNGIYHKVALTGNYYNARSTTSMLNLPQLDRLNDDASDQTLRDIRPNQPTLNPNNAANLIINPLFNPQYYALRRLIDNRTDTLDSIDVFQMGLRQRLQTKRGFPGNEHVVDWMTFDLEASLFPQDNRDNFGSRFGVVEYDWLWNIGDRTALAVNGWLEPVSGGPSVFTIGGYINRPNNTNVYLGYRQIDPLNSRAVIASVAYPFSSKYSVTASTVWDFGVHNQAYSFMVTRLGSDVQVSFGITYNSILNNLGVAFEIVPNLLRGSIRPGATPFNTTGLASAGAR